MYIKTAHFVTESGTIYKLAKDIMAVLNSNDCYVFGKTIISLEFNGRVIELKSVDSEDDIIRAYFDRSK
jgi:hypothetical protein